MFKNFSISNNIIPFPGSKREPGMDAAPQQEKWDATRAKQPPHRGPGFFAPAPIHAPKPVDFAAQLYKRAQQERDITKKLELLSSAAEAGSVEAFNQLIEYQLSHDDFQQAVTFLDKLTTQDPQMLSAKKQAYETLAVKLRYPTAKTHCYMEALTAAYQQQELIPDGSTNKEDVAIKINALEQSLEQRGILYAPQTATIKEQALAALQIPDATSTPQLRV